MSSLVKYYVVLPFIMNKRSRLVPGEARQAKTEDMARRLAARYEHAIAFYRTGDPLTGDWDDAVIIEKVGEVPISMLEAMAA